MANMKDGRVHRGMYINNRLWMLAWYGGKLSKRSRPDFIAHAIAEQLKKEGVLSEFEKIPAKHKKRISEMLEMTPPDARTAEEMLSLLT